MNSLPAWRQIINARTFAQPWSPSSMDPVTHYKSPRNSPLANVIFAVLIGIAAGVLLIHWAAL